MDFVEFGLDERLMKGIEAAGYVSCTPVQQQVIEASKKDGDNVKGPDLYVQSQTGTGKTAAYLVAAIAQMLKEKNAGKKSRYYSSLFRDNGRLSRLLYGKTRKEREENSHW